MSIYDAFHGKSDIRVMTTRHEQTTAYMADGYARVTGKPGVALVVPGPGVQNASAALGTAYAASSPVLLLAGAGGITFLSGQQQYQQKTLQPEKFHYHHQWVQAGGACSRA